MRSEDTRWQRLMETRTNRRTVLKLGGAIGGLVLLAIPFSGCQPSSPAAPKAKKELFSGQTGGVGMFSATIYVPFFVAEKKGYFAEEGLKLEITEFKGGADVSRSLEAGELKFANLSISPMVNASLKGAPLKNICGVNAAAGSIVYIVPANSPIKSIKDIKGKTVSFSSPGALTDFFARRSVKVAGYAPADVKLVPLGTPADSWTAAKSGIIDVAWCTDGLAQKLVLEGQARLAWSSTEVVPAWQDTIITTTDSFIQQSPDVLRGFVRALQKGQDVIGSSIDEAAKLWSESPGVELPLDLAKALIKAYPKEAFTTKFTIEGIKVAEEGMRDLGLTKPDQKVPWDKLMDQQFLPDNMRIDISKLMS